jgi:hypothetical protein
MAKYKPTKREVCVEIFNGIKSTGKGLKEFGQMARTGFEIFNVGPYCIPTAARIARDTIRAGPAQADDSSYRAGFLGAVTGLTFGIAGTAFQVLGYNYAVQHDHPEVLAVPVVTNLVSGALELYRNAKQRVVERHGEGADVGQGIEREKEGSLLEVIGSKGVEEK